MGTELMRVCVKEENDEFPSVPPGFESYTSLTLKRFEGGEKHDNDDTMSCAASENASVAHSPKMESESVASSVKIETESSSFDKIKTARSLRRRTWINSGCSDVSAAEESNCLKQDQNSTFKQSLPKGVIRGCPECSDCQKVVARWHPEDACRPDLEDAPVFYPTEEEFDDALNYIAKIRPKAEQYGICRIVPPSSWKPLCPLKEKQIWEGSKFATRVQRVDKLQNRDSMRKMAKMYNQMKRKRRKCMKMAVDCGSDSESVSGSGNGISELQSFGFEPGPMFTLNEFQKYADEFKAQYFRRNEIAKDMECKIMNSPQHPEPLIENIEGEYWRIVEKATEEIEVLYGADLETGIFGSGFPRTSSQAGSSSVEKYIKSGWNLNNFPRLPGSVLSYESSDISGVLVPWLYIGMCFSSFCWHVEDHHLYSLNYMHWGAPKMWYGVPGQDATKLEKAMRKHLPDLFEEQPDLLHKLITQLSPSVLKAEGVPVCRCTQNAGEFVLTFPRAYHAGFNSGFNCAEAVNVAPVDWLPHGQIAIELYSEQHRKTSISHDKLLLGAARDAVKAHWEQNLLKKNTQDNLRWRDLCGKDGVLAKVLKARVEMERARREYLCNSSLTLKMHNNFDATSERECCICFFDLHLSAAACRCSPEKYSCLNHVKQLCSCPWVAKYFLFRYDIDELNVLVEALEGKLSAVYRWARQDLGLALSAYIGQSKREDKLSPSEKELTPKEPGLRAQAKETSGCITNSSPEATLQKENKPSGSFLDGCNKSMKEESIAFSSNQLLPPRQLSQGDTAHAVDSSIMPSGSKKTMENGHDRIILLSDDEGDEPKKPGQNSSQKPLEHNRSASLIASVADSTTVPHKDTSVLPDAQRNNCLPNRDVGAPGSSLTKPTSYVGNTSSEYVNPDLVDNERSHRGTPSCSQNIPDKSYRQKGPRIAKVIRRINCNVEPLAFGTVLSEKSWCNSQAIFPKGFRSRSRYINILDPTSRCHYVSEILDAGRNGPLFMVSLEHFPSEVFIHVSANRCWEMIRERVNQAITKQHKVGKTGLPPLQPPGSLDGLEMFGFTSPAIVQAIEALDRNRVCRDYWDSRPYSRPQVQIPQNPHEKADKANMQASSNQVSAIGTETVLRGLFKKATPDELQSLQSSITDLGLVARLLNDEIRKRSP